MPKLSTLLIGFLLTLVGILMVLGIVADQINDRIDRCADTSSGKYIWNDYERAKACE